MTTTPTSGAADLPAMVSKAMREAYNLGQRYWQQADSEYISQHKKADDTRAKFLALVEETCAALAAGQATAAPAVVQDDLITLRKPTTSAELLWLLKLAHLVISDVDKTLEETFAPAQPAAEVSRFGSPELQAMITARFAEKDQAGSVQEDAARVFTYKNQPCNNVTAWRFGEACRAAQPGGDPIDHGLSLLQKLQERGYGIVAIDATRKQGATP